MFNIFMACQRILANSTDHEENSVNITRVEFNPPDWSTYYFHAITSFLGKIGPETLIHPLFAFNIIYAKLVVKQNFTFWCLCFISASTLVRLHE